MTNPLGIEHSSARVLPANTVCLSRTASVGYVVIMGRPMATSQDFVNWVCSPNLDHNFLKYLFIAEAEGLLRFASGAVHQTIYFPEVKAFHICHPPLAEQRRIVGILDEALAGLARAKANAEKNLDNARALFDSHVKAVFTNRGERWLERRLGDVAEFKNGLNFTRQSRGQAVPIVGVGDFQDNTIVPIGRLQSVTIDGKLPGGYSLQRDDILAVRSNGSRDLVGRCMLVPALVDMVSYSGFVIRIRFDKSEVWPRFLLHFMRAGETRERLIRDGGGANISNINQAKLSDLPLWLPPIREQKSIAQLLDNLASETQHLRGLYEKKLGILDDLNKTLLHQAFSGAL